MKLKYKKATIEDINLLTKSRIEVRIKAISLEATEMGLFC